MGDYTARYIHDYKITTCPNASLLKISHEDVDFQKNKGKSSQTVWYSPYSQLSG